MKKRVVIALAGAMAVAACCAAATANAGKLDVKAVKKLAIVRVSGADVVVQQYTGTMFKADQQAAKQMLNCQSIATAAYDEIVKQLVAAGITVADQAAVENAAKASVESGEPKKENIEDKLKNLPPDMAEKVRAQLAGVQGMKDQEDSQKKESSEAEGGYMASQPKTAIAAQAKQISQLVPDISFFRRTNSNENKFKRTKQFYGVLDQVGANMFMDVQLVFNTDKTGNVKAMCTVYDSDGKTIITTVVNGDVFKGFKPNYGVSDTKLGDKPTTDQIYQVLREAAPKGVGMMLKDLGL